MRRRGPGVGGIKRSENLNNALKEKGAEIQEDKVKHMTEVIDTFRTHLEEFARKYKTQIRSDPVFRAQFQIMCEKVGVDPLASSKGLWGELLGLGDYYYELGVRIVEVCMVTRSSNGGLIALSDLMRRLNRRANGQKSSSNTPTSAAASTYSEDDVKRAVQKLKCLGSGFGLVSIDASGAGAGSDLKGPTTTVFGSKSFAGSKKSSSGKNATLMVVSVPMELDTDSLAALGLASDDPSGRVSVESLSNPPVKEDAATAAEELSSRSSEGLGWTKARAQGVVKKLADDGVAWIDGPEGGGPVEAQYFVLSVWLDRQAGNEEDAGRKDGGES